MDQTLSQTNRITPAPRTVDPSGHDHIHRRHMIVWTLLIILALIVIGIVTLKLYHKQREAEFQNSYSQAQIENQKKFIQQVANTPDSKPMTAAEQKAYFDSVKAADASQSSQAQADQSAYLEQVAARDRAVEAGARADYDKTH